MGKNPSSQGIPCKDLTNQFILLLSALGKTSNLQGGLKNTVSKADSEQMVSSLIIKPVDFKL